MSIFVVGINHKTASLAVREQVYFAYEGLALYLQDLLNSGCTEEAVLLSTCNRSELYCETSQIEGVLDWFCAQTALSRAELEPALYVYRDAEAIAHIMTVACGLDSMVVGEPQILGQLKAAFSESCSAGAVGALFQQLFQQIFNVAKEIRTTTSIGACPVSLASAAVQFAKQQLPTFARANVVLIGAGETSALLMRYLQNSLQKPITIVNRSEAKAQALLQGGPGLVYGLDEMRTALLHADVVFSATGSPVPLVTPAILGDILPLRPQPLMLVDIAVPRDIDPAVASMSKVDLFCLDDLRDRIEKNRQGREHAADKARDMIQQKTEKFMAEIQSLDKVAHTIRVYRNQIEDLCQRELIKARHQLQQGFDPASVLDGFAHAYTNKLLHSPSVQIRQAGVEGRFEFLRMAKQLFAIPDTEIELS